MTKQMHEYLQQILGDGLFLIIVIEAALMFMGPTGQLPPGYWVLFLLIVVALLAVDSYYHFWGRRESVSPTKMAGWFYLLNETAPNQRTVWTWSKTVLMALIVIGGIVSVLGDILGFPVAGPLMGISMLVVTIGIVLINLARWGYRRWRA